MIRLRNRPRLLGVVGGLVALLLVGETIVLATTLVKSGGPVKGMKVVTVDFASMTSTSFANVPGLSATVTVPAGEKGLFLITVSALTGCSDTTGPITAFCYLGVVVDGNPASPGWGAFNTATSLMVPVTANSMQYVAGPLAAGPHVVTVQGSVGESGAAFNIYEATLSVLRSRV